MQATIAEKRFTPVHRAKKHKKACYMEKKSPIAHPLPLKNSNGPSLDMQILAFRGCCMESVVRVKDMLNGTSCMNTRLNLQTYYILGKALSTTPQRNNNKFIILSLWKVTQVAFTGSWSERSRSKSHKLQLPSPVRYHNTSPSCSVWTR